MSKDIEDIKGLLDRAGFGVVVGGEAVQGKILELAETGEPIIWRCSGYGVHPNGEKCQGCDDCIKE